MSESEDKPSQNSRPLLETARIWFIWFFYIVIVGGGMVYHFIIAK